MATMSPYCLISDTFRNANLRILFFYNILASTGWKLYIHFNLACVKPSKSGHLVRYHFSKQALIEQHHSLTGSQYMDGQNQDGFRPVEIQ